MNNVKKLVINELTKDTITIDLIDERFPGIIIALKDNNPVGFISFYEDYGWVLHNNVGDNILDNADETIYSLSKAIQNIIKQNLANNFKVIEFED